MGCGVCAYGCPNKAIEMVNLAVYGLRPKIDVSLCQTCETCLAHCPGIRLDRLRQQAGHNSNLWGIWGPILSMWEGYAGDSEIRYLGSSGGIATALSLYCLEHEDISGVFHISESREDPLFNRAVISQDKKGLLKATGSRYCPAALCSEFRRLEEMPGPCVVVGKPCDIEALSKACILNPALKEKVFVTISIFCAGTPTLQGTLDVLAEMDIPREQVGSIRYRGCGWPGMTTVQRKDGIKSPQMSYQKAWGNILSRNGQLRCRLCPDSTGEYADISCGDPWYQVPDGTDPGRSLVLVRTENGRQVLEKAKSRGHVEIGPTENDEILYLSQKALYRRHCHLWGRLLALKCFLAPTPVFAGFTLLKNWLSLPFRQKIESIFGTVKRIILRRYFLSETNLYHSDQRKE